MRWLLILISITLFWGCSSNKKVIAEPPQETPVRPELTQADSLKLAKQYFLEALQLKYQKKIDFARYLIIKATNLDPKNEFLRNQLAEFQMQLGQNKDALKTLQAQNLPLDSVSVETLLLLAHLNLELHQNDSANIYYAALTKRDSTNGRYWWEWAQSLEEAKDYKRLSFVNSKLTAIMKFPESLVFRQLLLFNIAGQQDLAPEFLERAYAATQNLTWLTTALEKYEEGKNKPASLRIIKQLIVINPYEVQYRLKEVRSLKPSEAGAKLWETWKMLLPQIQNDTNVNPVDADSITHLLSTFPADAARLLLFAGEYSVAKTITDTLIKLSPDQPGTWALASGAELFSKDTVKASKYALKAWNLSKEEFRYASIYIELLTKQKKYQLSRDWLDSVRVLNKDPLLLNARFELDLEQGYHIENNSPGDTTQIKILREIRLSSVKIADSLQAYSNNNIGGFPSDFLIKFRKAIVLERLDSIKLAFELFESLLIDDPKNSSILNYYGYSLVDRDIDIQKGSVLIERALNLKPKETAYLDSKAWVLFKQKQYAEAIQILESILPSSPQDPTMLEHLGKCYEAKGDQIKTLEFKQKLYLIAPSHLWLRGFSE